MGRFAKKHWKKIAVAGAIAAAMFIPGAQGLLKVAFKKLIWNASGKGAPGLFQRIMRYGNKALKFVQKKLGLKSSKSPSGPQRPPLSTSPNPPSLPPGTPPQPPTIPPSAPPTAATAPWWKGALKAYAPALMQGVGQGLLQGSYQQALLLRDREHAARLAESNRLMGDVNMPNPVPFSAANLDERLQALAASRARPGQQEPLLPRVPQVAVPQVRPVV